MLLPVLIFTSIYSIAFWISSLFSISIVGAELPDINAVFYNEFFTILILADVFILLLSFQYTERYSQLIRNTGFVICTILIRLSFATSWSNKHFINHFQCCFWASDIKNLSKNGGRHLTSIDLKQLTSSTP